MTNIGMRIVALLCLLAGLLVVATFGGGCGSTDSVELPDKQLRALISDAGVVPLTAPTAEDPALVELGRSLFFDKILSGNKNISCATCHSPDAGTGDNLPLSFGEGALGSGTLRREENGKMIPRNAPDVFNDGVPEMTSMFWDSRVTFDRQTGVLTTPEPGLNGANPALAQIAKVLSSALAAQAMFPVTSHDEMRGQPGSNEIADAKDNLQVWTLLIARLVGTDNGTTGGIDGYRKLFKAAYPQVQSFDEFNFGHVARAIAAFERQTWTALNSPFDKYLRGDDNALTIGEKRGALLFFGKAGCAGCHSGPLLSDLKHHSRSVPQLGPGKDGGDDKGLSLLSGDPNDVYKFRTAPLRNVALTGPWMHDGAFVSLRDVVRHELDPAGSLQNYNASKLRSDFSTTLDSDPARIQARIASLDPQRQQKIELTDSEVEDLILFLHALTDPNSLNLLDDAPLTVPSGLPVVD